MEIDDPRAIAMLLATARQVVQTQLRPELTGEARVDAAMVANALALAARALLAPGTAWSARTTPSLPDMLAPGTAAAAARALRPHVAARLAVTQPGHAERVAGMPV